MSQKTEGDFSNSLPSSGGSSSVCCGRRPHDQGLLIPLYLTVMLILLFFFAVTAVPVAFIPDATTRIVYCFVAGGILILVFTMVIANFIFKDIFDELGSAANQIVTLIKNHHLRQQRQPNRSGYSTAATIDMTNNTKKDGTSTEELLEAALSGFPVNSCHSEIYDAQIKLREAIKRALAHDFQKINNNNNQPSHETSGVISVNPLDVINNNQHQQPTHQQQEKPSPTSNKNNNNTNNVNDGNKDTHSPIGADQNKTSQQLQHDNLNDVSNAAVIASPGSDYYKYEGQGRRRIPDHNKQNMESGDSTAGAATNFSDDDDNNNDSIVLRDKNKKNQHRGTSKHVEEDDVKKHDNNEPIDNNNENNNNNNNNNNNDSQPQKTEEIALDGDDEQISVISDLTLHQKKNTTRRTGGGGGGVASETASTVADQDDLMTCVSGQIPIIPWNVSRAASLQQQKQQQQQNKQQMLLHRDPFHEEGPQQQQQQHQQKEATVAVAGQTTDENILQQTDNGHNKNVEREISLPVSSSFAHPQNHANVAIEPSASPSARRPGVPRPSSDPDNNFKQQQQQLPPPLPPLEPSSIKTARQLEMDVLRQRQTEQDEEQERLRQVNVAQQDRALIGRALRRSEAGQASNSTLSEWRNANHITNNNNVPSTATKPLATTTNTRNNSTVAIVNKITANRNIAKDDAQDNNNNNNTNDDANPNFDALSQLSGSTASSAGRASSVLSSNADASALLTLLRYQRGRRFPGDNHNICFYIARSTNQNIVAFEARFDRRNALLLDISDTLDIYWLEVDPKFMKRNRDKGKASDRSELTVHERRLAYGASVNIDVEHHLRELTTTTSTTGNNDSKNKRSSTSHQNNNSARERSESAVVLASSAANAVATPDFLVKLVALPTRPMRLSVLSRYAGLVSDQGRSMFRNAFPVLRCRIAGEDNCIVEKMFLHTTTPAPGSGEAPRVTQISLHGIREDTLEAVMEVIDTYG